nr:acyl-coenzyme A thioesterase 13-like [Ipomoea batatas]
MMEKAKESVEASKEEAERVSSLSFTPHRLGVDLTTFYRYFSLRGIRVDCCRPGFISCTSKSLHASSIKKGESGCGAIATLVDEVGCAILMWKVWAFNVTVDISITYLSTAKLHVSRLARCDEELVKNGEIGEEIRVPVIPFQPNVEAANDDVSMEGELKTMKEYIDLEIQLRARNQRI